MDMALNWLHFVNALGIKNYVRRRLMHVHMHHVSFCAGELSMSLQVIFALDSVALQLLRRAGAHAFYIADVQLHASSQGDQGSAPLTDLSTRSW